MSGSGVVAAAGEAAYRRLTPEDAEGPLVGTRGPA